MAVVNSGLSKMAKDSKQSRPSGKIRSEEPETESWVVFSISGEQFNPDVITMELGIEPDRVIRPDAEKHGSIWQISSHLTGGASPEAHFWEILRRLLPVRRNLMKIARDVRLQFYCTIIKSGRDRCNINLSPRLLILIGYIGAGVEVEVRDS